MDYVSAARALWPTWLLLAIAQAQRGLPIDWHGSQVHWDWETPFAALRAVDDAARRLRL